MSAYEVRQRAHKEIQERIDTEVGFLLEQAGLNQNQDRYRAGRIAAFGEARAILDEVYRQVAGE